MKSAYNSRPVPTDGKPIEYANGQFIIPDRPIIPFIEGDGTGRDIWKASQRVFDAAVERAYGGKRKVVWYEILAGEKAFNADQGMAAAGHRRRGARFPHLHQGPADDAGGRRHPLAERGAAADAGPVRLRAAGALLPRRAFAGEASRAHERGHLPREYRGRVHGHRVGCGHAGSEEADRVSEQGNAGGGHEADSPGFRHRHQAHLALRHQAPGAPRHPVRHRQQPPHRDLRAQGQYSEIHGRRLPRLGLRTGARGIPQPDRHRARKLDRGQPGQESQR